MSQLIPNENTWVGFVVGTPTHPNGVASVSGPKAAEIAAAVDWTDFLITLNASTTGNTVPTPTIKTKFEKSTKGTITGTFTADCYRDDEDDAAWDLFPRDTRGTVLIKRFGGTGLEGRPAVGQSVEVWVIDVSSRAAGPIQSGAAQMFTITAALPVEPDEDAIVVA